MNKVGIIGFGSFGKLLAEEISPFVSVVVNDSIMPRLTNKDLDITIGTLEDTANCDVVIIAVGLSSFKGVCEQIRPHVKPRTVVMDVCSVSTVPVRIMQAIFGSSCKLLSTHPLFGPQSVDSSGSTVGHKIVWHEITKGPLTSIRQLLENSLGLHIVRMTPEEHDQEMAWIHGLTFFIGRGLVDLDIPNLKLSSGYYKRLQDLRDLEEKHSMDLFYTVECGNPYAKQVRSKLREVLQTLDNNINEENYNG